MTSTNKENVSPDTISYRDFSQLNRELSLWLLAFISLGVFIEKYQTWSPFLQKLLDSLPKEF